MIRIQTITVENFRGIRSLKLDLEGGNFGICGPNGTGKSGIVDAIEFALTGSITRLSGQGTSGITVKGHAPHVDMRAQPGKCRVVLGVRIPSLYKTITIERRVSSPNAPMVSPADPDVLSVMKEVERHPEFALSRREITKYVIATPGDRSKEVQALLRLDRIEQLRKSFKNVYNGVERESRNAEDNAVQEQRDLLRALGIQALQKDGILEVVNQRRQLLQLEKLPDLEAATSFKAGLTSSTRPSNVPQAIQKAQATKELDFVQDIPTKPVDGDVESASRTVQVALTKLDENPALLQNLKRESFLQSGADLIEGSRCPLCDTEWDLQALRSVVERKLADAQKATVLREAIQKDASPLRAAMRELESILRILAAYGDRLVPRVDTAALVGWADSLKARVDGLGKLSDIKQLLTDVSTDWRERPAGSDTTLTELGKHIRELPDPSKEDAAREYLIVADEKLDRYRRAQRQKILVRKAAELAKQVLDSFCTSSDGLLTNVYRDVQADFSRFYRFINRDDEATFQGKLTPSLGKLGFEVDFYGRGLFPPGAYHSEGHQDGMGLCLYLSLMKHTLGKNFTFSVLDDVLMSVDAGHRREVCGLLKSEFPETQFIFTTHDKVWLQHMKTENLLSTKSSVQFRKWTVDDGPMVWNEVEIWKEIEEDLSNDDVPSAAGALRRFLEYIAAHLSDRLRAKPEFRGDSQYELGDLMPAVIAAWKDILKKAREAAKSWGKGQQEAEIKSLLDDFVRMAERTQVEQWAINKSIHYNEWAKLRKEDFRPVAEAFKEFLASLRCDTCSVFYHLTPRRGSREGARCDCGALNLNLKERP